MLQRAVSCCAVLSLVHWTCRLTALVSNAGVQAEAAGAGQRQWQRTSWMATRSLSFILSNSSMHTRPRSASTIAPASSRRSPVCVFAQLVEVVSQLVLAKCSDLRPEQWPAASRIQLPAAPAPSRTRVSVVGDGRGEADARGAAAGGADGQRRHVHHRPQQLALCHARVAHHLQFAAARPVSVACNTCHCQPLQTIWQAMPDSGMVTGHCGLRDRRLTRQLMSPRRWEPLARLRSRPPRSSST